MYTNIDTIFDNSAFDNIFNKVFEAQPAITWPINLYTEGDNEVIEIAMSVFAPAPKLTHMTEE